MPEKTIRMSPAEYINEKGILKQLPQLLERHGVKNPVVLTDETVYPIIEEYLPDGFLKHYPVEFLVDIAPLKK